MMNAYFSALWQYLILSAPYLSLGLILSGFIHAFLSVERVKKWLGGHKASDIFVAAAVGVPLPLCSCSVIPTAVTLKKAGASNAATSSFLISTPESGVDSIIMTYALIDLPMTFLRPLAAFSSGILAGFLQLFFNNQTEVSEKVVSPQPGAAHHDCCHAPNAHAPVSLKEPLAKRLKEGFRYAFVDLLNDLSLWLTIGILAGALIETVIPEHFFADLTQLESRLMILLIGIPLYICASAATPIAASLMLKGLAPGSALLLLLVGPATNISSILVLQKYLGKKGVILNIISITLMALIFAELADYLYAQYFDLKISMGSNHDHGGANLFEKILAAIFAILLLNGIYHEEIKPRLNGHQGHNH